MGPPGHGSVGAVIGPPLVQLTELTIDLTRALNYAFHAKHHFLVHGKPLTMFVASREVFEETFDEANLATTETVNYLG